MGGIALRSNALLTPVLRDAVPTPGKLDALVITSTGFTEPIEVGTFTEGIAFIYTTAHGTTLDCDLQYGFKDVNGVYHWVDSGDSFTQITTTDGLFFKKFTTNFGLLIRFRLKPVGSYTVTMRVALKG